MSLGGANAAAQVGERFNPFPGLRTFEPDEDYLFFGREKQIDELLRRLRTTRFLSIIGTSGSGKSSLVRAGLIPSLYGGAMTRAGASWRVAILRPGEDPIGNLAAALAKEEALSAGERETELTRAFLATTLRASNRGLVECIRQARLPARDNVLVLVDQFEEIFRFKRSRRLAGRDEALGFVKLLLEGARDDKVPCYVALTMRSDFIGDCMEFGDLPETVNDGLYLVPRMTREELRQAITGPVAVGGGEISPRLVSRLLNDVGDDPDQLPILQHALLRTWERWEEKHVPAEPLDLRHYEAIGTMDEALSRHAEEAFGELDDEGRPIARVLFGALTDKSTEGRGIRRPSPLAEISTLAGVLPESVTAVVDRFRQPGRSFLMPPASVPLRADSILDLSHESLMRVWKRLAEWVEEEARSAQLYLGVAQAAARHAEGAAALWRDPELQLALTWRAREAPTEAWARRYDPNFARAMAFLDASQAERDRDLAEREEQRRARRRRARVLMVVLLVASLVTTVLGGVAYLQKGAAEVERDNARAQGVQATKAQERAQAQKRLADQQKLIAEQERRAAEQERRAAEQERQNAEQERQNAERQTQVAEVERRKAENSAQVADTARSAEQGQRQKAEEQRRQAEAARRQAEESERQAQRLSRLSLARALALQIVRPQPEEERELWALLALQAYRLHRENGGPEEDADLSGALRTALGRLRPEPVLRGPQEGVRALAVLPDGRTVLSGGEDGKVLRFDLQKPDTPATTVGALASPIRSVALSPGGDLLAVGGVGGELQVWSLRNPGAAPRELAAGGAIIGAASFHPGGRKLAAGSADGSLRIWDMEKPGEAPATVNVGGKRITSIAFSPKEERLAVGLEQGGAALLDLRRLGEPPRTLCSAQDVRSLAFSPDGKSLACGASRGEIAISRVTAGSPLLLRVHSSSVNSLSFDPRGTYLASASSDGTLRLWDLRDTDSVPIALRGHLGWVWTAVFTPDGERLISGSEDRTLRIWAARTELLARELCRQVHRHLSRQEWSRFLPPDLPYTEETFCPAAP